MPIFQDPDRQRFYDLWSDDHRHEHQHGRQERQETRGDRSRDAPQPWNDFGQADYACGASGQNAAESFYARPPGLHHSKLQTSDREELIQYLKSVKAPSWIHDRPVRLYSLLLSKTVV